MCSAYDDPTTYERGTMMTTERQQSCAERLPSHLRGRLDDFERMIGRDDAEEGDDDLGPLSEYPLWASVHFLIRVDLSTGGPADYLKAEVDEDGEIVHIDYHFADWFDHAQQALEGDDFETARYFIENLYGDLSPDMLAEGVTGRGSGG